MTTAIPMPWAVSTSAFNSSGCPKARAGGEKARHLVAEGAVVRVLLHGHELQRCCSRLRRCAAGLSRVNSAPGPDFFLGLGHARVDFVDERRLGFAPEAPVLPLEGCVQGRQTWALKMRVAGSWTTRRVQAGMRSPRPPGQYTFKRYRSPWRRVFLGSRSSQTPSAFLRLNSHGGLFLPSGAVADEKDAGGVWRPFSQDPLVVLEVQAEILVAGGEIG